MSPRLGAIGVAGAGRIATTRGARALACALAWQAAVAYAWAPIDRSEPTWSGPVPFATSAAGSVDLGADASRAIVQRAFADWAAVSCTSLEVRDDGITTLAPITGDGHAVIGWVESAWRYDPSAIGVTQPQWAPRGTGAPVIVEADMELNGVDFTWTTEPGHGGAVNAASIVLHEAGHFVGLGHSSDPSAAMYFAYSGGVSRLDEDDQAGICALYPDASVPPTDCHSAGCPSGRVCAASGVCVDPGGGLCARCTSAAGCASGACLRYPDGLDYCGTPCATDAECGPDATCMPGSDAGAQCVRLASGAPSCAGTAPGCTRDADCASGERCNPTSGLCRTASGAGLGATCASAGDCASNVCFDGLCSATCDWLSPTSCGDGFFCSATATGTCTGVGLCVRGSAGAGAIGAPCAASTDCIGLFCAEGTCSQPCVPGDASGCPIGYACQVGSTASCGSCQITGQLGDACAVGRDCASALCVEGACSRACDPAASTACPTDFTCIARGEGGVCVADRGGLGAPCASDADCLASRCLGGGVSVCTRACDALAPCPRGYDCLAAETGGLCQPRRTAPHCGCAALGRGTARGRLALVWLACLTLGVIARAAWSNRRSDRRARS